MVQRCLQVTSGEWVLYHRRQQHQHHHHHHPNVLADACSLYALSSLSEEPYSVSQSRGASVTDKECLPAWAMRMQPKVKWQCRSKGTPSFRCTKSWEPADAAAFWWPKVRQVQSLALTARQQQVVLTWEWDGVQSPHSDYQIRSVLASW